jgi:2-polyprenyl-3-methyl-5-hydroxy-6-metoxy-1,4-benzoquinol methylase
MKTSKPIQVFASVLYSPVKLPIENCKYDVMVSNYVFEHVGDVNAMASKAIRVLKPGGIIIFRTPNLWHYLSLISRLTPHWFNEMVSNRIRNLPSDSHNPYQTYYRINTRRACQRVFSKAGSEKVELITIEKNPLYRISSSASFLAFMCYERFVNISEYLAAIQVMILGAFRKP